MGRRTIAVGVVFLVGIIVVLAASNSSSQGQPAITVEPGTTYQTITGWVAVAEIGQVLVPDQFHLWRDTVADLAVNDLGINVLKIRVRSGFENPVDYFTQYLNGDISRDEWKTHWFEVINDNADASVINPAGYQFSQLDHEVDNVVAPLRARLAAKGETLAVYVVYSGVGSTEHADVPEEYAELVLATYQHLESKYGWVPDGWSVHNEPNSGKGWGLTQLGNALVAAGDRLQNEGYTPVLLAPEHVNMSNAVNWFDSLIQTPGVAQYLKVLTYHRYAGVSDASLQAIGDRAVQHGVQTAMLEHIGSGYEDLHKDLKIGHNSAWEQFALAFPLTNDNGGKYYLIDTSDPANPVVNMDSRTKFLRQYFKFVRSGAVRIDATSNNGNFDPVAFINTDGTYVVVVKADAGGSFDIHGLPAGTYGIKYTTASAYDVDLPDVAVGAGQVVSTSIPGTGAITIYGRTKSPPGSVAIDGATTGVTGVSYAFDATVSPVTAALPVTYTWRATGQSPVTHSGGLSDTITYSWSVTGTQTLTVSAANAWGIVSDTHTIAIAEPSPLTGVKISGPTLGVDHIPYRFSATVSPATAALPVTYTWRATGQSPVTHSGGLSDTITYSWNLTGTQTLTVSAANAWGTVTDTHTIELRPASRNYLPLILLAWLLGILVLFFSTHRAGG